MPEISLRAYIEEVDRLIEREQLDEAIAHCRHILQIYPKHLATYRLLGKAYLEAKRYGDAADIFQRVLSAVPDDFVAHIGMAIVREDEGNLDAAIWHMERSFETNPANPAIQQEMIRLIGRRDGLEPHKVRLTRGALARMYAHGELFPQAIAELRSALQEDPNRPDLQVLLAQMYWKTDQRAEATAVCSRILLKLPFAYEANRIMATALRASNKPDEATVHHRRLAGLDPYFAFMESAETDPKSIEPSTVSVDRLDWQPGQPLPSGEPGQPGWAESLGVDLREEKVVDRPTGPLPSWLDPDQTPRVASAILDEMSESEMNDQTEGSSEGSRIPSWMKEAGWDDSSGEVEETPVSFTDDELSSLEGGDLPAGEPLEERELTPADIPSWLQEIAPQKGADAVEEPPAESDDQAETEVPSWLEGVASVAEDVAPDPTGEIQAEVETAADLEQDFDILDDLEPVSEAEEDSSQQVPSWLDTEPPGATETIVTWLEDREPASSKTEEPEPAWQPPEPVETVQETEVEEPTPAEIPDWLSEVGEQVEEEPAPATQEPEIPGWLSGVAEAAAQEEETPAEDFDWIREQLEDTPAEEEEEFQSEPGRTAEAPDWLQAIAQTDDLEETEPDAVPEIETLATAAEEKEDAWLQEFAAPELESSPGPAEEDDDLSWMVGLGELEVEPVDEAPALDSQPPDWLQGIAQGEPSTLPPEPGDAPDWLAGLGETLDSESPQPETEAEELEWLERLEEEAATPEGEPLAEAAPDWLTRLRVEEPEVEPAGVEAEEAPDWLMGFDEEPPVDPLGEPADEAPDWLQGIAVEDQEAPPTLIQQRPVEVPSQEEPSRILDDLEEVEPAGLEEELPEPAISGAPASPPSLKAATEIDDEEVSDWLESLAKGTVEEIEPVPTIQEFLSGKPIAEAEAPVAISEDRELPEEPEESLQWLEELAESRGIEVEMQEPEATQPVAEPPLPGTAEWDETPEWLRKVAPRATEPAEEDYPAEATPVESAVPVEGQPIPGQPITFVPDEPEPAVVEPEPVKEAEPAAVEHPISTPEEIEEPVWIKPEETIAIADLDEDSEVPEWLRAPVDAQPRSKTLEPATPEPTQLAPEVSVQEPEIPQTAEEPVPPPPSRPVVKQPPTREIFENARKALAAGDHDRAVEQYGVLIKQKIDLEKVIEDLRLALERTPNAAKLWQSLGDAFMRQDKTAEAIDAYQKGMESS